MTNPPADLLAHRGRVMRLTGQTNPAEVGIVGDGAHQRTGGYHEGEDVLVSIGAFHNPPASHVGSTSEDYSARLLRDRVGLTNSASAIDYGRGWPNGGDAAYFRFVALMVAEVQTNPVLAPVRGLNYSTDGKAKHRIDREHGWRVESTTDSVDVHLHAEFYRNTEGTPERAAALTRIEQLISAAAQGDQVADESIEVETMFLASADDGAIYLCDGIRSRHITTPPAVADVQLLGREGNIVLENNGAVRGGWSEDVFGALVQAAAPVNLTDAQLAAIADQVAAQLGGKLDQLLARLAAAGDALDG